MNRVMTSPSLIKSGKGSVSVRCWILALLGLMMSRIDRSFLACPNGETTKRMELNIVFPAGLASYDKKGVAVRVKSK